MCLVARITSSAQVVNYDELTREQLLVACQSHGLAAGGKRMDMVGALKQWAWYLQNIQKITMEASDGKWLEEVQDDGGVYSFGNNHHGQLGLGNLRPRGQPQPIIQLCGRSIQRICVVRGRSIEPVALLPSVPLTPCVCVRVCACSLCALHHSLSFFLSSLFPLVCFVFFVLVSCPNQNFQGDWVFAIPPRGSPYAWGGGGKKPLNTFNRSYRMPLTRAAPREITFRDTHFDLKVLGIKAEWLPDSSSGDDADSRHGASSGDSLGTHTTTDASSVSTLTSSDEDGANTVPGTRAGTRAGAGTVDSAEVIRRRAQRAGVAPSKFQSTHAPSSAPQHSLDGVAMAIRKRRKKALRGAESARAHAERKERKRLRAKRRMRQALKELEAKQNRKVVYRLAELPEEMETETRVEECVFVGGWIARRSAAVHG